MEGRTALSPHRAGLCQGRVVLQPKAAVLSPFRDDRPAFFDDISLFAAALEGIR
jgi:hypothetical protein